MTVPHSQEQIILLAQAKTHGQKFVATGGGHLTSDDFFKAMEVGVWKKEIALMEKDKEERIFAAKIQKEAHTILCLAKGPTTYLSSELLVLLKWYQVPPKEVPDKTTCVAR